MSDYASLIDSISQSQAQKEVTANAALNAAWPAMMFARRDSTSSGLTWGYYGGRLNGANVGNGIVLLTASATNYIVVHRTTLAVSVATTTTNWNDTTTYGRAYQVTVGTSSPSDWQDVRLSTDGTGILFAAGLPPSGAAGGGLSGSYPNPSLVAAGANTQIQYNNSNAFAADSRLTFDATNKVAKGQFTVDSGGVNAQTGTTYTLAATDNGAVVTLSNASAITVTVPSGLGKGFSCICIQIGAGQVTFSASSTTLNGRNGLKTGGQHAAVTLIAYIADTFNVAGDTTT